MSSMTDRYRRWYAFEKESHEKVIDSLESIPEGARTRPEYDRAIVLLAHVAAARQLWLYRFGVLRRPPAEFFPKGLTLEQVRRNLSDIEATWDRFFTQLEDSYIEGEFSYQSLEGEHYRNRIEDILTQLFGHSLYHRGQIALLVRQLGGRPAETDFVFWSRREISAPE